MSTPTHPNTLSDRYEGGVAFDGHVHHDRGDGFCETCHTKLREPPPPFVPNLAFIRERMPNRADKGAYLIHALRFFEDVLDYAERLETTKDFWKELSREKRAHEMTEDSS